MRKAEIMTLVLVLAVAIFFRFWQLDRFPPGLYPDEAVNGNDARAALETGNFHVFYSANNGREGLFINIQALFIHAFGSSARTLRSVSAVSGIASLLGLYAISRRMMNWQIAAIAAFLFAVSFWPVDFSRIGFRAILGVCFAVWSFYFLWRGLSGGTLGDFGASGALFGLGLNTYISFRLLPLVIIFIFIAWWHKIKKDYSHAKYEHMRNYLLRGFAFFVLAAIIVALPIGLYFYQHPDAFFGRADQVSVFQTGNALGAFVVSFGKALAMFTFYGDSNWRHNISGAPMLIWPVGWLFVVGLIRSIIKLFRLRRTHGHYSTVHVMLLSWFIAGILPSALTWEGTPHALRALLVVPVVMIFAAEGLWWLFSYLASWYHQRDADDIRIHHAHMHESRLVALSTLIILLFAIGVASFHQYFIAWGQNPNTAAAFNAEDSAVASLINALPLSSEKYVAASELTWRPQAVMFLTDTSTPATQQSKHIHYLTTEQFNALRPRPTANVFILAP